MANKTTSYMDILPNDVLDSIFMIIKKFTIQELKENEMHGNDERICIIKSIKRLYDVNHHFLNEIDCFIRNELVTYGFGPGEVFEPFVDALKAGLSWRDLCKIKPEYSCCGWGVNNLYNLRDLRRILSVVDAYHPGIPINGWGSDDEYEHDIYYNKYIEINSTYAKK